ncbi:hypothetical protein [Lolliginicoccus suaedae]|uniref:hypothetical protein n=1 Tax=Lolliginicoccus suaedae TaxID=2605429 RepID=UPI0011EE9E4E|nr:hypothetical protein [Lolliginicoccus suaedae]
MDTLIALVIALIVGGGAPPAPSSPAAPPAAPEASEPAEAEPRGPVVVRPPSDVDVPESFPNMLCEHLFNWNYDQYLEKNTC